MIEGRLYGSDSEMWKKEPSIRGRSDPSLKLLMRIHVFGIQKKSRAESIVVVGGKGERLPRANAREADGAAYFNRYLVLPILPCGVSGGRERTHRFAKRPSALAPSPSDRARE